LAGCVCTVPPGPQLREQGGERCVVVALCIPVLLDCRKPFPPYKIKLATSPHCKSSLSYGPIELIYTMARSTSGTPCWSAG
jgi:hypothetical protein